MIDLHLHLLPGIDDGAADFTVASSMLHEFRRLGFTHLVATPHLVEPLSDAYLAQVDQAVDAMTPLAEHLGIELLSGFEVVLTPDLPQRLKHGEQSTLAGSTAILVELPLTVWPTYTESTLYELQTAGYHPILAHPERYSVLQRDPTRAVRLAEQGVSLQVTTSAISGLFGKPARRLAERWLQAGMVNVVATDAHSMGRRMSEIPAALERLDQLVGARERRRLTIEAPTALLTDTPLPRSLVQPEPQPTGLIHTLTDWLKR